MSQSRLSVSPAGSPAKRAASPSMSACVANVTSIKPGNKAQARQIWGTRVDDKRSAPINMPKSSFTAQAWKSLMKREPNDFSLRAALPLYGDPVTGRYALEA